MNTQFLGRKIIKLLNILTILNILTTNRVKYIKFYFCHLYDFFFFAYHIIPSYVPQVEKRCLKRPSILITRHDVRKNKHHCRTSGSFTPLRLQFIIQLVTLKIIITQLDHFHGSCNRPSATFTHLLIRLS